jgi:hypothetical protein
MNTRKYNIRGSVPRLFLKSILYLLQRSVTLAGMTPCRKRGKQEKRPSRPPNHIQYPCSKILNATSHIPHPTSYFSPHNLPPIDQTNFPLVSLYCARTILVSWLRYPIQSQTETRLSKQKECQRCNSSEGETMYASSELQDLQDPFSPGPGQGCANPRLKVVAQGSVYSDLRGTRPLVPVLMTWRVVWFGGHEY